MSAFRVLVCGGRDYARRDVVNAQLDAQKQAHRILCVIDGGARGADKMAHEWALANGQDTWTIEADWKKHGKAAGPIRNQRMLDEAKPDLVIALPGGIGTADMVRRATAGGFEVVDLRDVPHLQNDAVPTPAGRASGDPA